MIYIVIPVFNRLSHTKKCLDSLLRQTFTEFRIVVVDDGSTDGTQAVIRSEYPQVILLETPGDLFWTGTINIGIQYALDNICESVITLNNDTFAPEDWVEQMVEASRECPNALVGSFALDSRTKEPIYGGERIIWKSHRTVSLLRSNNLPNGDEKKTVEVTHFPGRGLLIPKSVFEKIGLFDEDLFPHYYADFDFTYNAYKHGFKIFCNLQAKLYIFPEESGDRLLRKKKTLKNYYNHLFSIRGGGNIKNFTLFTVRHCPPHLLLSNLFVGITRRIVGFWIK